MWTPEPMALTCETIHPVDFTTYMVYCLWYVRYLNETQGASVSVISKWYCQKKDTIE